MNQAERLGGQIAYLTVGERHGVLHDVVCWPAGTRPIDDLLPFAGALSERSERRVVLVQPRGCEGSTLPVGGHTLADLAGDVAAVLLELDNGPAVLLGHAFGNRVMRMTSTLRPDLVSGVVLLASGGMFPSTTLFWESIARAGDADLPMDERLAAFGQAYFEEGTDPSLWWRPPSKAASKIKDAEAGPLGIWWNGGSAPMLVVQGELDQSAPPANGEALLAANPHRVELHTIPGAAHTLPIDRPVPCADLVTEWLARRP
jgi:pimeloyl-ACP methyl ester carboxylesterase